MVWWHSLRIINSSYSHTSFDIYSVAANEMFSITSRVSSSALVLNIPNYITKFGMLRENLQSEICMLVN